MSDFFISQDEKDDKNGPLEIYKPPSRILKFLEHTKWYWPVFFLILSFGIYYVINPQIERETYSIPQYLSVLLVSFTFLFLPFYAGLHLGINMYKPKKSLISKKQLRFINEKIIRGETINISTNKKMDTKIKHKKNEGYKQ